MLDLEQGLHCVVKAGDEAGQAYVVGMGGLSAEVEDVKQVRV